MSGEVSISKYPDILLHDAVIDKLIIDTESNVLKLCFRKGNGFWVKDGGEYYMAEDAMLVIHLRGEDPFEICVVEYKPILKRWMRYKYKEIDFSALQRFVTKGDRLTIIEEFYNTQSCCFDIWINRRMKCVMHINTDKIEYFWGKVDHSIKW